MKRLQFALLTSVLSILFIAAPAVAQARKVVASTSWTAAIARAAGAENVVVIAPLELKHPPEYEIKPSDLEAVKGAALVVYGGYEKFAKRLVETSGGTGTAELKLFTDNIPMAFKAEAKKVAEKLGTVPTYEQWAVSFDSYVSAMRSRVQAAYPDKRAVVHKFLKTYVEWLGFEVVGTFGPGEPSPAVVLALVKLKPAVVIDNYHNPSGKPVAESLKAPLVELINFPGKGGTKSIEDVFAYNERQFTSAGKR
ncbi:MAG: zinc ABC transporter substrate-binding protein [Treponemataceae bacterium]